MKRLVLVVLGCTLFALVAALVWVPTGWVAIENGRVSPHYAFENIELRGIWDVGERDAAQDPEGHRLALTWWERRIYWPIVFMTQAMILLVGGGLLTLLVRRQRRRRAALS